MLNAKVIFLISCFLFVATSKIIRPRKIQSDGERALIESYLRAALGKVPKGRDYPNVTIDSLGFISVERIPNGAKYDIDAAVTKDDFSKKCKFILNLYNTDHYDELIITIDGHTWPTYNVKKL